MTPPWSDYILHEHLLAGLLQSFSVWMLLGMVIVSIAVLSYGADAMVEGVVHMARRTRLPEVVIGATIVSLGTTSPEAFVSVMAAVLGNPGLALGNGVGSIIADTGLIFGTTCILTRVPVKRSILNRTGWWQVGSATLLVVVAVVLLWTSDGPPQLGRVFGLVMLGLLAVYLFMTYRWALLEKNNASVAAPDHALADLSAFPIGRCWLMVIGGLLLVLLAARVLIPTASAIAFKFHVPDDIIAATMVALGTSLPELMTAITSVRKGHPEIAVGNVVGADVLNCLFVIGAAATARPLAIPPNFFRFHFPAMLLILWSLRWFISRNDTHFTRKQGLWLLTVYVVYVGSQFTFNIGPAD